MRSKLRRLVQREHALLRLPLSVGARVLMIGAAAALVLALLLPLWRIRLVAPQYQEGLTLKIYTYQLVAGNNGQDLHEINGLNHYIGMKPIEEADFIEMRWVPFALGVFILLALRASLLGSIASAVDLLFLFLYFTAFSFGSFYYRLYTYGHQLDPRAPVHMEPFTPVLIGRQQIANFQQSSWPDWGTLPLGIFPLLVVAAIWMSRRQPES